MEAVIGELVGGRVAVEPTVRGGSGEQVTVLVLWIGTAERVSAMRSTSTTRLGRGSAQPRTSLVG
ncbi:hypothetical protein ACFWOT_12235 [Streptomyces sp. NPDC058440]|uniref:hypothetical protein n=1 Tax=Streptomyces sp. NPDC058440 TaxID=3346501 RepID=UPI0036565C6B